MGLICMLQCWAALLEERASVTENFEITFLCVLASFFLSIYRKFLLSTENPDLWHCLE